MQESVSPQVTAAISEVLSDKPYDAAQVPDWVDQITDSESKLFTPHNLLSEIIKTLCQKSESLKYIVSVIILEKKNGGFHLFSTCYWDQETDGTITIRWDNKAMHCVVSVFGIAVPS